MKMIFFDTETTGIRPGSICQLSYISVDTSIKPNTTIGRNLFFTVDYIEPSAEKIHGFSLENLYELSNGTYFEDCFESFIEDFRQADILIGHNVNFDIKFLVHELEGCGEELIPKRSFCTMNYYKDICKINSSRNGYKNPKLAEVVQFLQLSDKYIDTMTMKFFGETGTFHDARFDTTATYLIVTEGIKRGYFPKHYFSKLVGAI